MINVSDEFKQLMTERQDFKCNAEVTLANGTVLPLGEDDFSIDNNSLVDAAGANTIPLGVALSRNVQLEIMNGDDHLSNYDFFGAKIRLYLTFELSETTEKIEYGTFTVTQPEGYGNVVTIVGYDDMYKADKAYSTTLTFPATAKSVLIDSCDTCGILIGNSNFLHNDFQIPSMPSSEYTHRQIIGFIAMIACGNARIDRTGRLQIMTYDFDYDSEDIHKLVDYNKLTSDTNDVQVTGVRMTRKVTTTDDDGNTSDTEKTVQVGKDGYVLSVENPLVTGHEETLISWIYEKFGNVTFRAFTMDYISYPIAEFMDKIKVTDWRENSFYSVLTDVNFVFFGYTTLKNSAESPLRNQSNYTSSNQKAIIQGKQLVEQERNNRQNAVDKMQEALKNSNGMYSTQEVLLDGSTIYYLHDKPTIKESKNVIKLTAEVIGFSIDGGKTYPYGFTITGEMVARLLYTEGINADYINTGALTVKDKSGNIIFYADMETGTVKISGDNVTIGGKTAPEAISDAVKESKNYADGKVSDFAETVTKSVADLQNQIDGQIETFYYDYEPTLKNIPASDWTTEDDKKKHEGDLFYWKSKGYAYRFFKDGDTWKWQLVQDTDVTKALQTASFAQSTADSKCRVFVVQPTPPYDTGDMWNQGQNGDILTCVVARGEGASFVESDWQKLNKYTDDETAKQALSEARKSRAMLINLDNDYQAITTDYKGEYTTFPECHTTAQVLWGHTDISNDCSYSIQKSSGIVGSWDNTTHTYTVTALIADTGWIDITANYLDTYTVTKRFDVAKVKSGAPGAQGDGTYLHIKYSNDGGKTFTDATVGSWIGTCVDSNVEAPLDVNAYTWAKIEGKAGRTYFMETSSSIVKMSADSTIVPNFITLSGYYRDGTATARTAYKCRFKIEETTDGDTYTTVYTSSSDETDITHALYSVLASGSSGITASGSSGIGISRNLTALRCTMYAAGGFSQVLDIETIPVAIDVDALTHEDIFNLLTNDGAWQGIYRGSDGKLYINFTYARGGTLNFGGKANTYGNGQMHVYDANDNEIVDINTKGIVVTHYISGMGEKPISYVCITPDVFGGIYLSENKDGTGACAILSPDEIVLKNNSSGPITIQTDITMHMTDESLYLGSVSEYKFHFGKEKSSFYQPVTIGGSLSVAGTKNRIIDTENYDTRKQYCYETATPYFGDIGSGCTDNTGKCYIDIDDIFSETVNIGVEYQVFLQKEGQGDIWVEEKTDSYFVVKGTENLKFSWEIKAIQKDYEFERLEKFDNSEKEEVIDYEKEYMEEINDLIKEQEEMLNETVE